MKVRVYVPAAVLAATATVFSQPAEAPPRFERPLSAPSAGPHRLRVDVPLLAGAARFTVVQSGPAGARAQAGLADLRLYDAAGREVPHLLIYAPSSAPVWIPGTILPVAATRRTSGFEADLSDAHEIDELRIDGLPAPFLKRLTVEGSGDRGHWTMLAAEATVFDLPQERLRQVSVPFPAGSFRYVRVTWDDTNSGRMPSPAGVFARTVPAGGLSFRPLTAAAAFERRPSEPGVSRYRIRLPAAGLPLAAVRLDVGAGHVFRPARVTESRLTGYEAVPVELGRETLARIERDGATATVLRVPIAAPREAEVELVVEDGSNPPLNLQGVSLEFAELPWIYFEAPGGALTARYGRTGAAAPTYDLEAVRATVKLADVPEAAWGEPRGEGRLAATAAALPDTGAAIDVGGFRFHRDVSADGTGLLALPLDAAALAHSRGPDARFADVRLVDASARQIPYLVERREEPLAMDLALRTLSAQPPALRSRTARNRTAYAVTLPYPNLPSPRLVLETSDRVFQRHVEVGIERAADRRHRDAWLEVLASGAWQHARQDVPAPALLLPIAPRDAATLLVVIDEGDNRPLAISAARLLLPSWRLRFYGAARPVRLLYGHDELAAPRYDLALLAPQLMGAEASEATAAPESRAEQEAPPAVVSPRVFWMVLAVAVIAIAGVIAKLVTSSGVPSPPSPPRP